MPLFFFLNQGLWGMTSRLLVLESVTAGALISCLFMCRCLSVMCWWSACVSVVGAAPARVLTGAAQIPHVCVWALDLWRVTLNTALRRPFICTTLTTLGPDATEEPCSHTNTLLYRYGTHSWCTGIPETHSAENSF